LKNIFTSLHTQPKPKNIITASYLLYCIVIYFTLLHIIFYFYLHSHLVLDNHSVELGTQERGIVLQVARRRTTRAFLTVPESSILTPEFPLWGKFTLATTLCTWSPNLAHLLSVIKTIFWRRCRGTKENIHNCYLHRVKAILQRTIFFTRRTIT
jgi:hypothetical protein